TKAGKKVNQKHKRVGVLSFQMVPDKRLFARSQGGEGGALAIAGAGLQEQQTVIADLQQAPGQPGPQQRMARQAGRFQPAADDPLVRKVGSTHDGPFYEGKGVAATGPPP